MSQFKTTAIKATPMQGGGTVSGARPAGVVKRKPTAPVPTDTKKLQKGSTLVTPKKRGRKARPVKAQNGTKMRPGKSIVRQAVNYQGGDNLLNNNEIAAVEGAGNDGIFSGADAGVANTVFRSSGNFPGRPDLNTTGFTDGRFTAQGGTENVYYTGDRPSATTRSRMVTQNPGREITWISGRTPQAQAEARARAVVQGSARTQAPATAAVATNAPMTAEQVLQHNRVALHRKRAAESREQLVAARNKRIAERRNRAALLRQQAVATRDRIAQSRGRQTDNQVIAALRKGGAIGCNCAGSKMSSGGGFKKKKTVKPTKALDSVVTKGATRNGISTYKLRGKADANNAKTIKKAYGEGGRIYLNGILF